MPHFSGGVVTRLVQSYLLSFHKRCLSFVLVCSNIWSLLFTMETVQTEKLKRTIVLLPSGRSCVSTRRHWLAKFKTFWHNYSIASLCNACMWAVNLPSHPNSKLKQTAYSVKPTPESIEHPVRVSTAWQSVRQPHQIPSGRGRYSFPSVMIPGLKRSETQRTHGFERKNMVVWESICIQGLQLMSWWFMNGSESWMIFSCLSCVCSKHFIFLAVVARIECVFLCIFNLLLATCPLFCQRRYCDRFKVLNI